MRAAKETLDELLSRLGLIIGHEDPPDDGNEGDPDDSSETGDEDDADEEGDEEDDEGANDTAEAKALREALKKERRENRTNARELKKLQRQQERDKGNKDDEAAQARKEANEATEVNKKLAAKLRDQAVDGTITRLGSKLRFRDMDDALRLIDRTKIEVDQDDDDPSDIEIDETTVSDALKALAKAKPHLLLADGDDEPSGGNLGGRRKDKGELDDQALRDKYPALARGTRK